MAVIYELVKMLAEFLAGLVGVESLAIGVLATGVVALYYLREVADVFVVIARYARIGSLVGAVLLLVIIGGDASGFLELGGLAEIVKSIGTTVIKVIQ